MSLEYQRWLIRLLGYNFEILYKPGVDNKTADSLSRIEQVEANTTVLLLALTVPSVFQLQDIYRELDVHAKYKDW